MKVFFYMLLVFLFNQNAFSEGGKDGELFEDGMQDISIVMGTAAGGAILGLSTLSFVEKPKEHLKSIVVGGAMGIILGVAIVGYISANKSKDLYFEGVETTTGYNQNLKFKTIDRISWHHEESLAENNFPALAWNFSF
jgi:hypothetical protein